MAATCLDCWFLTGPTAGGKTAVGLELARMLGAEIISLDSMAVYRGMDIGTAKPTPGQRARIPHHLIDVVDPDEDFSVAQYVDAAHREVSATRARGNEVLFVGGTPLYLKAMLRGIFDGPPADWEFRSQAEEDVRRDGVKALHRRLEQVDPLAASRLHPNDVRRIIRALEVHNVTGRPISQLQTQFDSGHPAEQCKAFVLDWPPEQLQQRIDRRVDEMVVSGLIDEVRGLVEQFPFFSRTALQAVGYREIIEHLRGERDLTTSIALIKTRTWQFASRQRTWFRSLSECRPLPQREGSDPARVARQILAAASRSRR